MTSVGDSHPISGALTPGAQGGAEGSNPSAHWSALPGQYNCNGTRAHFQGHKGKADTQNGTENKICLDRSREGWRRAHQSVTLRLSQRFGCCSSDTTGPTRLLPVSSLCYSNVRGPPRGATKCYQCWASWVPETGIERKLQSNFQTGFIKLTLKLKGDSTEEREVL